MTRWIVNVGSMTCLNFSAKPPPGVLQMRLNTGPVIRVCRSKYFRPIGSGTWTLILDALGPVGAAPRDEEFAVRNGHFVNGIRRAGAEIESGQPLIASSTPVAGVRCGGAMTYSPLTPKYSGDAADGPLSAADEHARQVAGRLVVLAVEDVVAFGGRADMT